MFSASKNQKIEMTQKTLFAPDNNMTDFEYVIGPWRFNKRARPIPSTSFSAGQQKLFSNMRKYTK